MSQQFIYCFNAQLHCQARPTRWRKKNLASFKALSFYSVWAYTPLIILDLVHFLYTTSSSLHLIWCCTFSGHAIISIITWQGLGSFISTSLGNMRLTKDCAVGRIANRWGSGPCFIRGSAALFGLKQPRTIRGARWSARRTVSKAGELCLLLLRIQLEYTSIKMQLWYIYNDNKTYRIGYNVKASWICRNRHILISNSEEGDSVSRTFFRHEIACPAKHPCMPLVCVCGSACVRERKRESELLSQWERVWGDMSISLIRTDSQFLRNVGYLEMAELCSLCSPKVILECWYGDDDPSRRELSVVSPVGLTQMTPDSCNWCMLLFLCCMQVYVGK